MHGSCQKVISYIHQLVNARTPVSDPTGCKPRRHLTTELAPPPMTRHALADFDYPLPRELIAQAPAAKRSGARLLHIDGPVLCDLPFTALPRLVARGDLVVFNDTRVVKARLDARRPTGGAVELLLERSLAEDEALFQLRASHPPRAGGVLLLPADARATVILRDGRFVRLRLEGTGPLYDYLERHGRVPLPPYISRSPGADDDERYQTVYARDPGAAAAPTAGLHFDRTMLDALGEAGAEIAFVTLHVGAGTFQPVESEDLSEHRMHAERYRIPAETAAAIATTRASGGRVIAVGTTTLRALESAAVGDGSVRAGDAETAIFITPGHRFRVVDRLVTNFHLPKSTLLMLVSAFAGFDAIRAAYAHAVRERYRFFSYGDASLLERTPDAG
jgi:S-adenosylmethionine:tRNA ribosyltransferase-isomerase